MRNTTLAARWGLALAVVGTGALVTAGCHRSDDSATKVDPAQAGNLQNVTQKPRDVNGRGGGVPDMNVYPAPNGVKTGVLPGGQK